MKMVNFTFRNEHKITGASVSEAVSGVDLVKRQIEIASSNILDLGSQT